MVLVYVKSKFVVVSFNMHIIIYFTGGPLREFLHLIVKEIVNNNTLFSGPMSARVPVHNMQAVEKRTFKYIGVVNFMLILGM